MVFFAFFSIYNAIITINQPLAINGFTKTNVKTKQNKTEKKQKQNHKVFANFVKGKPAIIVDEKQFLFV